MSVGTIRTSRVGRESRTESWGTGTFKVQTEETLFFLEKETVSQREETFQQGGKDQQHPMLLRVK